VRSRTLISTFLFLLAILPKTGLSQDEEFIKGSWFTEAEEAIAAAKTGQKPILAVAMDHG
jgi:hypothetical protein